MARNRIGNIIVGVFVTVLAVALFVGAIALYFYFTTPIDADGDVAESILSEILHEGYTTPSGYEAMIATKAGGGNAKLKEVYLLKEKTDEKAEAFDKHTGFVIYSVTLANADMARETALSHIQERHGEFVPKDVSTVKMGEREVELSEFEIANSPSQTLVCQRAELSPGRFIFAIGPKERFDQKLVDNFFASIDLPDYPIWVQFLVGFGLLAAIMLVIWLGFASSSSRSSRKQS